MSVVLNGCVIAYSYDKLSKKCRSCMNKDYCREKHKEKYGVLASPIRLEPTTELSDFTKLNQVIVGCGVSTRDAADALFQAMQYMDAEKIQINAGGSLNCD